MFANTQMMGMDLGFPDVCLTPMPLPVPVPYPIIAMWADGNSQPDHRVHHGDARP